MVAPQHTVREPHPTIWCDALSRPCSEGYSPVSNDVLLLVPFADPGVESLANGPTTRRTNFARWIGPLPDSSTMTTRRPERPKLRRRKQPATAASQQPSAADLRTQLDQRTCELAHTRKLLTEALQQQTATADVLKVISRSAFDLKTVLDSLLGSACRLCEADFGTIRYQESSVIGLLRRSALNPNG